MMEEMKKRLVEKIEKLEKRIKELEEKMQIIEHIVPICSSCKKIRTEEEKWIPIEEFLREHMEFTHSLCPECARKLYPEFYKKQG